MFFRKFITKPEERPSFTQAVKEEQPTINGYTLQVDVDQKRASIIISKKGGSSMIKTVVKALEGFETLFDEVSEMKANIEAEKEEAIKVAIAEVEEKYAEKSAKVDELFAKVSVTEEIEVPDEETVTEEVAEETEATPDSNNGTISF